jgi:hypothetical protein
LRKELVSKQENSEKQNIEAIMKLADEKEKRDKEMLTLTRERDLLKQDSDEKDREVRTHREKILELKKETEALRKELADTLLKDNDRVK